MQINKAALEIFDFTSSLAVYSEHELKIGEQDMHIALWESESVNINLVKSPLSR